jgi:uncharacterized NAD(P)/FAD-binding protein YdhS
MQNIIIIGGGLSGTLLTINLLRNNHRGSLNIIVIEKNSPGMLGQAYSTDMHFHLLNVPAMKMSAFPDKTEDFTDWLSETGYNFHNKSFVPRRIYKQYILDTLKKLLNNKPEDIQYTPLNDRAMDIVPSEQFVVLESGKKIHFDKVILALGNFDAATLNVKNKEYLDHPFYFASTWDNHLLKTLPKTSKVLIIGTGLTMVDTVLYLHHQQHSGEITALSVHGFTPMPHLDTSPYQFDETEIKNFGTALEILKMVNRHLKKARKQNISWHAVVDAIRPFTQQIWLNLPLEEKKKFMEHLRHIWGVSRHRVPAECAGILYQLLSKRQLSIIAGRIKSICTNTHNSFSVEYQARSSKKNITLFADAIVNCMGPESNYEKLEDPLIKNLLKRGMIRTDSMKLGIDCTPEGIIIDKHGKRSPFLYTIGPPVKGTLFEITSVPEIRIAALQLAELVISKKDEFAY